MSQKTDWMPGTRVGQLSMAKQWQAVIAAKATAWAIPAAESSNGEMRIHALPVSQSETVLGMAQHPCCAGWWWVHQLQHISTSREAWTPSHNQHERVFVKQKLWAHGRAVLSLYPQKKGSVRL